MIKLHGQLRETSDQCLRKRKFVFERMEVPQKEKGFRLIARTVALLTLLSQDLTQPFLLCHFWFMSWSLQEPQMQVKINLNVTFAKSGNCLKNNIASIKT